MSFFVWNKMSARNLLNYYRNHNALDFFFKGKWKGWMKWPLHQPCEPLSLLLLSITLTASHKCHTISKISLTFILTVPKKKMTLGVFIKGEALYRIQFSFFLSLSSRLSYWMILLICLYFVIVFLLKCVLFSLLSLLDVAVLLSLAVIWTVST